MILEAERIHCKDRNAHGWLVIIDLYGRAIPSLAARLQVGGLLP